MNKIIIPSIFVAVLLVAITLAIMPVEKASTVHTAIQANTAKLTSVTKTDTDVDSTDTASVTCTQPFIVRTIQADIDNSVAADITATISSDADGSAAAFVPVNILTGVNVGATSENVIDAALPSSGTVTMTFTEVAADGQNEALSAFFIIEVTGNGTCS